jgi:hypothetical protein
MGAIRVCPSCGQTIKQERMTIVEVLEERLRIIQDYAEEHPEFDTTYIDSLHEQLCDGRPLTPKQVAAINNIIDKFEME